MARTTKTPQGTVPRESLQKTIAERAAGRATLTPPTKRPPRRPRRPALPIFNPNLPPGTWTGDRPVSEMPPIIGGLPPGSGTPGWKKRLNRDNLKFFLTNHKI